MTNAEDSLNSFTVSTQLNFYCVDNILRRLSLLDRLNFAQTCKYYLMQSQYVSAALDKSFSFEELNSIGLENTRTLFKLFGSNIQNLSGKLYNNRLEVCKLIGNYCINLKTLMINDAKLAMDDMRNIFANIHQLEELALIKCNIKDEMVLQIIHLSNLKTLNLCGNTWLTGLYMNQLPSSIEVLDLKLCSQFKLRSLPEICKSLPSLKELDIIMIHTKDANLEELVSESCCDSLETLRLDISVYNDKCEHIARLPSLKSLDVCWDLQYTLQPIRHELLEMLVAYKSTQLKSLRIRGINTLDSERILTISNLCGLQILHLTNNDLINDKDIEKLCKLQELRSIILTKCANVSDNGMLTLILACSKLVVIVLNGCNKITNKLLQDIVRQIDIQGKQQRALPISISAVDTQITVEVVNMMSKDILTVTLTD